MSEYLSISQAAKAAGLSVDAIRFYEREGILIRALRTSGGRRLYGRNEVLELIFIARLRAVRMSLPEIGRYLALARQGDKTLAERTEIVAAQRERVVEQIAALQDTLRVLDFKLSHAAEIAAADQLRAGGSSTLQRRALRLVSGAKSDD
jgi:DNA-binding transcriptional MerR regulator